MVKRDNALKCLSFDLIAPSEFRMILQKLSRAIALAVASTLALSFLGPSQNAYSQNTSSQKARQRSTRSTTNRRPPAPPNTPPPNSTRPGGGLNPDETPCRILNDGLRALIPVDNPVLTTSAYPTFLFYVPAGSEAVQYGEFSLLLWPDEEIRQYTTRFRLPESRGIVTLTIPELPAYALAENQTYRWYFQLYHAAEETISIDSSLPDFTLKGSVQRVPLTPERTQQLQAGSPEIWYDTLSNVATRLQTSPQSSQLRTQWHTLLALIDAEAVSEAGFAGPVLPLED